MSTIKNILNHNHCALLDCSNGSKTFAEFFMKEQTASGEERQITMLAFICNKHLPQIKKSANKIHKIAAPLFGEDIFTRCCDTSCSNKTEQSFMTNIKFEADDKPTLIFECAFFPVCEEHKYYFEHEKPND